MQTDTFHFHAFHWPVAWRRLLMLLCLAMPLGVWAQQAEQIDPPARVAYISVSEGSAQITGGDGPTWAPAVVNTPITTGVRLTTQIGARTELHTGWSAFRLAGPSALEVTELDDTSTRLALTDGSFSARLRDLQSGERFEVNTPNVALVANQPGEYRFDVNPANDTTRVSVHDGSATVYGDAGQAMSVRAGEQLVFVGRSLSVASKGAITYRDDFDQWVASRNALDDRSVSARYVSAGTPGYQQLDAYGDWAQETEYGAVWYPRVTVADWAPYRYGHWAWVDPWGWTWVDDAPWGFAPSHYGRWAQIGPRWAWVPGPMVRRPVYAPAVVGFIGGSSGDVSWSISVGSGPGAAWFPLAPGEYWEPSYRSSTRYRRALNPWANARPRSPADVFHFQRRPHAVTIGSRDQFGVGEGRRPRFTSGTRVPSAEWSGNRLIPPPPRPGNRGDRNERERGSPAQRPPFAGSSVVPQHDQIRRERERQQDRTQAWQEERQRQRPPHQQERPRLDQPRAVQPQREHQQQQMLDRQREMRGQQQQIDQRRSMQREQQFQRQRELRQDVTRTPQNQQRPPQMQQRPQREQQRPPQMRPPPSQRDSGGPPRAPREDRGAGRFQGEEP